MNEEFEKWWAEQTKDRKEILPDYLDFNTINLTTC
jgi:hypothetical protein